MRLFPLTPALSHAEERSEGQTTPTAGMALPGQPLVLNWLAAPYI